MLHNIIPNKVFDLENTLLIKEMGLDIVAPNLVTMPSYYLLIAFLP